MSFLDHAAAYWQRFKLGQYRLAFVSTGSPENLDLAIEAGLTAYRRDREAGYPVTAAYAAQATVPLLRDRSYLRDTREEAAADLDLAEALLTDALDPLAADPPYRSAARVDLASILARRYELTLDPADLHAADTAYTRALADPVLTPVNRSTCLISVADLKHELFEREGRVSHLHEAVAAATAALALPETTPEHRFETRCVLADAQVDLAETGAADTAADPAPPAGVEADWKRLLDAAVTAYEDLLTLPPEQDVNRELPRLRGNLAHALRLRQQLTGDPADLRREIELLETVLGEVTAPGTSAPPDRAAALRWLTERDRPAGRKRRDDRGPHDDPGPQQEPRRPSDEGDPR
ncbi:hypothetical protein ACFXPT_31820 [Streptomyces goshikiensis]|uniref:hypothetical protein n=1 Tax=Streptomyces goshikiensis TaxID=1942 RepID=UPI0036D006E4